MGFYRFVSSRLQHNETRSASMTPRESPQGRVCEFPDTSAGWVHVGQISMHVVQEEGGLPNARASRRNCTTRCYRDSSPCPCSYMRPWINCLRIVHLRSSDLAMSSSCWTASSSRGDVPCRDCVRLTSAFRLSERRFAGCSQRFRPSFGGRFSCVVVHGTERELRAGLRDEVYRIGRGKAIVNACRHSRARDIEAEVRYRPTELRIAVRDNGCGIDPHELQRGRSGHWGLQGMRERADRIGARLRLLEQCRTRN